MSGLHTGIIKRSLGLSRTVDPTGDTARSCALNLDEIVLRPSQEAPLLTLHDLVVLGFVPGWPTRVLSIVNPTRVQDDGTAELKTTYVWQFDPQSLVACVVFSGIDAAVSDYKRLVSCSSAFVRDDLIQVCLYCGESEQDSGMIVMRYAWKFRTRFERIWTHTWTLCSPTEGQCAATCYSRCPEYVSVVLQTSCLFFLLRNEKTTYAETFYWSGQPETEDGQHIIRSFEFDLFIEHVLARQPHVFGHDGITQWTYYTVYLNHPSDLVETSIRDAMRERGRNFNQEEARTFVVSALGADETSVLLVLVMIDPTADGTTRPDVLLIQGTGWRLKSPSCRSASETLAAIILQKYGAVRQHDCRTDCPHRHSEITVLPCYETHGKKSIDFIEGEQWHIAGPRSRTTMII